MTETSQKRSKSESIALAIMASLMLFAGVMEVLSGEASKQRFGGISVLLGLGCAIYLMVRSYRLRKD